MPENQTSKQNSTTPRSSGSASFSSLGDDLPKEIERCQELLVAYAEIGPVGNFGAAMIKQDISRAVKALASGDVVEMIQSYEALKGCN